MLAEVIEQRIVPCVHVLERLPEGDVQDVVAAPRVADAELNEEGGLAYPGPRHHHPELPGAKLSVRDALQHGQ